MLSRPRIKSCYRATVLPPNLVFLMTEHSELVFDGPSYVALAPLLDGARTLTDILSEAGRQVPWPGLFAAMADMERRGCLIEGDGAPEPARGAFWDALDAGPERVAEAYAATTVSLRTLGDVPADAVSRALGVAGFRLEEDGALAVVAADDYLYPELGGLNRDRLAAGRPWALLKPVGSVVWVGPIFRPGDGPCWECLAQRLKVNRQLEHYLCRRTGREAPLHPSRGWLASSLGFASALAASELARSLVQDGPRGLAGKLLTVDLVRRELKEHVVMRRPQCPACGAPASGPRPVQLESRPKLYAGQDRSASAAETFERWKHHLSPISGVVSSLSSRDADEHGLTHNYVAGHYFPLVSNDVAMLGLNLVARAGGKGRTAVQAKTGALCEALERYSGIAWGDEPKRVASYASLGDEAVHIRELALFSDRQYAEREAFNAVNVSEYHDVPPPLDDQTPISWSPAWSLTHTRIRYLPTAYCYYGFRDHGVFFTRCDSNGSAAGNSLEEAILYAFLELAERDSVALWWYNRARRPAVDGDSFELPYWREMQRHYRAELRRELHALDVTADLGIPAFAVASRRVDRPVEDVIVGFAAHLDPRIALNRALEEANQYLPAVRDELPDGSTAYRLCSEETVRWWRSATYANQPYLVPDPQAAPRRLADFASLATDDVRQDVEACVAAAGRAGLEVLVVDQTRPDIGVPVVKVVVPGLRHFWRRLGPGRLYDVPVRLGWLPRAHTEDELNPISCFV